MRLANQILMFLTVTTLLYLAVRYSGGFARATGSVAGAISTVQKTAQGR